MLDRIAESLFWIGRYTERAENHARLIDVYYHLREESNGTGEIVWRRIVGAIGDPGATKRCTASTASATCSSF
ncbi:alpha-E domain-containing protein [Cohnella algarum]|nr:alpha-E domain-containing protein [Cohnella algarum]MBN2980778.1 alpha-E domain-containing protein [Cohnella algarum]